MIYVLWGFKNKPNGIPRDPVGFFYLKYSEEVFIKVHCIENPQCSHFRGKRKILKGSEDKAESRRK